MRFGRIRVGALALGLASFLSVAMVVPGLAATSVVTVTAADLESSKPAAMTNGKWFFYDDNTDQINNALGTFVVGPGSPPYGAVGSAQISTSGTGRPNLATYRFSGTPLNQITSLKFSTYNPSAGNGGSADRSGYLQFNVDFNGSDTWQSRLVYVPRDNGAVVQNTWQEWDAINGGNALWRYSGAVWPGTGDPGMSTLKSWDQIKAAYPGVRIRVTDAFLGIRVGEPYANGYTENIDTLTFGTAAGTTTYDFEPYKIAADKDQCKGQGWQTVKRADGSSFKNQGDCVSYTNTGR